MDFEMFLVNTVLQRGGHKTNRNFSYVHLPRNSLAFFSCETLFAKKLMMYSIRVYVKKCLVNVQATH